MTKRSRPTLADVAEQAGVSLKTASRALNGEYGVAPATLEKVRAAARLLGFRPNLLARSLASGQSSAAIGLIISDVADPFFGELIGSVELALRARDLQLVIASHHDDADRQLKIVRALVERRVDALLLTPAPGDASYLADDIEHGLVVIALDRPVEGVEVDTVVVENRVGSAGAVRDLIAAGHRRIAALANDSRLWTMQERLAGYRLALAEAGIAEDPALVVLAGADGRETEASIAAMLASSDPPTAIFAHNATGREAIRAMRAAGIELPLISFDESSDPDLLMTPPLVIQSDPRRLGWVAAEMALERLDGLREPARLVIHPVRRLHVEQVVPLVTGERAIVIGLDIGTARIKALGFGLDGDALAEVYERPTPWSTHGDQAEMDPGELAEIVRDTVASVPLAIEEAGGERVRVVAVGVTGMGEAGVLADGHGRPLARILAWHDPRGDADVVRREVGEDEFQRAVGMPLNAQPSLAKILWLRRSIEAAATAVRFLSLPEWGVVCLGGEPVSELSLASRTGLLDIGALEPFAGAIAVVGRNLLSELVQAGDAAGTAGGDSLPASIQGAVLTVAGHDHQAAALAVGAARPGALFNSLGTAEALVRCVDGPLDPAAVGRLAAGGTTVGWGVARGCSTVQEGLRTGLVLERLAALLGAHDRASRRLLGEQALEVDLAEIPPGVIVSDAETRPQLASFADGLPAAAVWAAAVRDLTDASARRLECIEAEIGPHSHVTAAGGWTRNAALLAAKRRQFGDVEISGLREAGTTGAALLAGVAAGVVESPETDAAPVWPGSRVPRANSEVS